MSPNHVLHEVRRRRRAFFEEYPDPASGPPSVAIDALTAHDGSPEALR